MKMLIPATALMIAVSTVALAQPAQMLTTVPRGKTIANYYKQDIYDFRIRRSVASTTCLLTIAGRSPP